MLFVKTYILDRKAHEFRTPIERDWAYVCRREWVYDCNIGPTFDGIAVGLCGMIAR